jgi:beta-phosphoglucomutase-like phosphatase (HAD superfamily)
VRAVIFDLDGTLVDAVYAHAFAWYRHTAERFSSLDQIDLRAS